VSFIDKDSIIKRIRRRYWFIDAYLDWKKGVPGILIGVTGPLFLRRPFSLRGLSFLCHKVISGKTGSGKSNFLGIFVSGCILLNTGVFLIDPHADLARRIIGYLRSVGFFKLPNFTKRLLYINFGIKDELGKPTHFLPLNILKQPFDKYDIAENFVEVIYRIWPYLRDSAPHLSNILVNTIIVLIDNDLPITKIEKVLTNREYREKFLLTIDDEMVLDFFHTRFDRWGKDEAKMVESTLNKIGNIIFTPKLRHSLEQKENALNFREIIESGTSVIANLGGLNEVTQKFIGCFLTIGMETAMSYRENIAPEKRKPYFFVLDEFQMFVNNSEKSFNKFLSEARKYNVFVVVAHQYTAQLPEQLQAALQNSLRITFKLEDDSLNTAEKITEYKSDRVKREVEDTDARKRSLPRDFTPLETFHEKASEIKNLCVGEAFIKLENRLEKVLVNKFPEDASTREEVLEIEMYYANLLMIKREELEANKRHEKEKDAEIPFNQQNTDKSPDTQRQDIGSFEKDGLDIELEIEPAMEEKDIETDLPKNSTTDPAVELNVVPNKNIEEIEVSPKEVFKRERRGD